MNGVLCRCGTWLDRRRPLNGQRTKPKTLPRPWKNTSTKTMSPIRRQFCKLRCGPLLQLPAFCQYTVPYWTPRGWVPIDKTWRHRLRASPKTAKSPHTILQPKWAKDPWLPALGLLKRWMRTWSTGTWNFPPGGRYLAPPGWQPGTKLAVTVGSCTHQ
jgi:hypothetical protein